MGVFNWLPFKNKRQLTWLFFLLKWVSFTNKQDPCYLFQLCVLWQQFLCSFYSCKTMDNKRKWRLKSIVVNVLFRQCWYIVDGRARGTIEVYAHISNPPVPFQVETWAARLPGVPGGDRVREGCRMYFSFILMIYWWFDNIIISVTTLSRAL